MSAAADELRLTEDQQANRTFSLKIGREIDEFAVIASKLRRERNLKSEIKGGTYIKIYSSAVNAAIIQTNPWPNVPVWMSAYLLSIVRSCHRGVAVQDELAAATQCHLRLLPAYRLLYLHVWQAVVRMRVFINHHEYTCCVITHTKI